MSLKLHFASLSLGASVDQQTGNLSVFDLVEEVKAPQLPIHIQSLVISLALEKTQPATVAGRLFIHILTPDGKQAMVGSGDLRVPPDQKRMKAVFRFGGFPITQFGAHRFVVSWVNAQGTKEGEALLDFDAVQVQAPTQATAGTGPGVSDKPSVTH